MTRCERFEGCERPFHFVIRVQFYVRSRSNDKKKSSIPFTLFHSSDLWSFDVILKWGLFGNKAMLLTLHVIEHKNT